MVRRGPHRRVEKLDSNTANSGRSRNLERPQHGDHQEQSLERTPGLQNGIGHLSMGQSPPNKEIMKRVLLGAKQSGAPRFAGERRNGMRVSKEIASSAVGQGNGPRQSRQTTAVGIRRQQSASRRPGLPERECAATPPGAKSRALIDWRGPARDGCGTPTRAMPSHAGMPNEIAQQNVGHASLATTT